MVLTFLASLTIFASSPTTEFDSSLVFYAGLKDHEYEGGKEGNGQGPDSSMFTG